MKLETGGKRKQSSPRKSCEKCVKIDLARFGLKQEDAENRERWEAQTEAKIANPGLPG